MTATTTSGQPLPEEDLERVLQAADMVLQLDADKLLILDLVKMRMHKMAPNLSEAVGEEIAARLMGVAGSLENLSKMPACNVQVSLTLLILPIFSCKYLNDQCFPSSERLGKFKACQCRQRTSRVLPK